MEAFFVASGIRCVDGGVRSVAGTTSTTTTGEAVAGARELFRRGGEFVCHVALCRDCLWECQGRKRKKEKKKIGNKEGKKALPCKNLVDNLLARDCCLDAVCALG